MPSLADTQAAFRRVIDRDNGAGDSLGLVTPGDPVERLSIYRRHFRESFRRHLRGRFPTVEWLVGTPRMIELADAIARTRPPRAPSLAEYGSELAAALSGDLADPTIPYVADVAWLDWYLGNVAVATTTAPRDIADLASIEPDRLADVHLNLQSGLVYLAAAWPVDTLLGLKLAKSAPDRLEFEREPVWLELRGARGAFSFTRLGAAVFAFRKCLLDGNSLGVAAEAGLASEPGFDISAALAELFAAGLVTAIPPLDPEASNA